MDKSTFSQHVAQVKIEWEQAFRMLLHYYENESLKHFRIAYDPVTWFQFKNPALIYPAEREMRFSTPNAQIPFDYYPSLLAKFGIMGHNFAYIADIEEYYPHHFSLFLWEQQEYITPLQRANLRAAQFMPDALVEVTREGLRSFLKARGKANELKSYEEPLVTIETLGLMGMPRSDDILTFFKELKEAQESVFETFLETPYIFSFAGLATPPALNEDKKYGIRRRDDLTRVKMLMSHYMSAELPYEGLKTELEQLGYTTTIEELNYKPEDSVDLRWIKLDYALERVKKTAAEYEHKAAHSDYYCYEDMAHALRSIYEKEQTVCQSYV